MRPGIKTTEFWLSLAIVATNAFIAAGVAPEAHWSVQLASAIIAGAAAIGYTVARAKVKVQEVLNPPAPQLEAPKPARPSPS